MNGRDQMMVIKFGNVSVKYLMNERDWTELILWIKAFSSLIRVICSTSENHHSKKFSFYSKNYYDSL
jgi:hypothetical protein